MILLYSTKEANCFAVVVLESSCTGVYTAVLRAKSSRTLLSSASLKRELGVFKFSTLSAWTGAISFSEKLSSCSEEDDDSGVCTAAVALRFSSFLSLFASAMFFLSITSSSFFSLFRRFFSSLAWIFARAAERAKLFVSFSCIFLCFFY